LATALLARGALWAQKDHNDNVETLRIYRPAPQARITLRPSQSSPSSFQVVGESAPNFLSLCEYEKAIQRN
jgi:hypothetical protein